MEIQYIPISISAGGNQAVLAAQAGKNIKLLALRLTTEAASADFVIIDSEGTNIGGTHHMGTGTGGGHHAETLLPYNPAGWCETGQGKGLSLTNTDTAAISGLAVVELR